MITKKIQKLEPGFFVEVDLIKDVKFCLNFGHFNSEKQTQVMKLKYQYRMKISNYHLDRLNTMQKWMDELRYE